MGYSENDFQDSYHDDPIEEISHSKLRSKFLTTGVLILGSIFFFQSTLAGNISLSSGSGIEFGQGISQTVACSGETSLTLTPRSSFTNASPGDHYLQSVIVSNIPDSCFGVDFSINVYNDTSSTPLALFNSTSRNAVIYNNAGIFQVGTGGTGMSVTSGSGTFTATFTTPVALSSTVYKITIQSGLHTTLTCAEGGKCIVGSRGPGNGIVFFVSASNFTSAGSKCNTSCKYLETAPSTWQTGSVADDSTYDWSSSNYTTGQDVTTASSEGFNSYDEKLNWRIGKGFNNTSTMSQSTAKNKVLAYAGTDSSAGQWFIPSMNELNELCKYSRGQTTGNPKTECNGSYVAAPSGTDLGGFVGFFYWSSSEHTPSNVKGQFFNSGSQSYKTKSEYFYLRPIRAF